jgi:hypothetical protein
MDEKNKKRGSNSSEQTLGEINYANAEYHQLYDEKQNSESEDASEASASSSKSNETVLNDGKGAKKSDDLSKASWGETSGLYPVKSANPTNKELFDPKKWDPELSKQLQKARAAIQLLTGRNSYFHDGSPNLKNPIEKMLSEYHMKSGFPDVDTEIKANDNVRFFYLAPTSTTLTPSIDSRYFTPKIVVSYGPFYSIGGGDAGKGQIYIIFYEAIKK